MVSCAHREEGVCIPQAVGRGGLNLQHGMEVRFCWSVTGHKAAPQAQDVAAQCVGFSCQLTHSSRLQSMSNLSPGAGDGFCLMTFNESALIVPN